MTFRHLERLGEGSQTAVVIGHPGQTGAGKAKHLQIFGLVVLVFNLPGHLEGFTIIVNGSGGVTGTKVGFAPTVVSLHGHQIDIP